MNNFFTKVYTEFNELNISRLKQLHCATVGPVDWYWADVNYVLDRIKTPFWSEFRPNKIWFYEYDGHGIMPGFGNDKHHMCAVYHYLNPAEGVSLFYEDALVDDPSEKLTAKQNETWLVNLKARQTMYFPMDAQKQKRQYLGFMYEANYEKIKNSLL